MLGDILKFSISFCLLKQEIEVPLSIRGRDGVDFTLPCELAELVLVSFFGE